MQIHVTLKDAAGEFIAEDEGEFDSQDWFAALDAARDLAAALIGEFCNGTDVPPEQVVIEFLP